MTDRLTPGQLRDLADMLDIPCVSGRLDIAICEEADRREAERKPAPDADDLVERLRENSDLDAAEGADPDVVALEREAADRIEAQEREIAGLLSDKTQMEARVQKLEYAEGKRHAALYAEKARADRLAAALQAVIDAPYDDQCRGIARNALTTEGGTPNG